MEIEKNSNKIKLIPSNNTAHCTQVINNIQNYTQGRCEANYNCYPNYEGCCQGIALAKEEKKLRRIKATGLFDPSLLSERCQVKVPVTKKQKETTEVDNKENRSTNQPHTPEPIKAADKPKFNLTPQAPKAVSVDNSPSRETNPEIEKYKDEIKNLKTALSLLQRSEPKEERVVQPQADHNELRKQQQYVKLLKKLLKKSVAEKHSVTLETYYIRLYSLSVRRHH
jgi:hypothetical protein